MLVNEGRDPRAVFGEFRSFVDGCVLAGHNVGYDVAIVRSQMRRLGLEWEPPPAFDTLELSRRLLSLPRYTLRAVSQALGLSANPSHRAMDDVRTTAELLRRLWPKLRQGQAARQRVTARFASAFRPLARRLEQWRQVADVERPM